MSLNKSKSYIKIKDQTSIHLKSINLKKQKSVTLSHKLITAIMIKKKLQPLKKPSNYNESTQHQQTIVECLTELVKEQKHMNAILHNSHMNGSQNIEFPINHAHNAPKSPKRVFKIFDQQHGTAQREKPIISLESQLVQQKQGDFTRLIQQGEHLMANALSKKIPSSQRKNYNVLNDFIPYTDRREYKILVSFETVAKQFPVISSYQILQKLTVEWIGGVFRMVASMCWNMVFNGFLTFDQTKILFTENIIYNYIQFMKELQLRGHSQFKHRLTSKINKKSIQILQFLGKQYPQTKIDAPNIHLKEILPKMNNSGRMKFDVITIACKKGFQLKFKESGNYAAEIMSVVNFMIDQVNEQYPVYEKECLHIFEQIFKLPEKRDRAKDGSNFLKQSRIELTDTSDDIMYRQKVKKYTKFLIGRKISKNVPKFSRQQISSGIFFPKSPSILRIITKWSQQLTDIIKNPQQHILSADKQLKDHYGNFVVLFSRVRKAVCEKIKQNRGKLFQKIEVIRQECFYIESLLSSPKYTEDSTQTHLSEDQICVGKFSVYLQKAISSYLFQQLNQILHFLLGIPQLVDETQLGIKNDAHQSEVRKELDKLNLVTMKIFDLLRCKCTSNEQQIIWIMNYLIQRNLVDHFKLIRVKDRLSEGTRDILCNLRFKKGGFLSQMQLSVVSNIESKQEKLDYYNHFLYELKRSQLGPLSQNVSIWTVLQQRSLYFQKISHNPVPQQPNFHKCDNQNLEKFALPICCESCINFYPYPETVYSNVKCKKCKKTYCGECYSLVLSAQEKKAMIFEGLFKQKVLNHIKQHNDFSKPFPMQGIYFMRYHQRRQINFFTVLMQSSGSQKPISFQSIKQLLEQKKQIQCVIIFTHNSIRNQKTIQKQVNINKTIRATIRNQNQLYINENDYNFFQQYLIYYFDQKFTQTLMTIEQIQNYLKVEQNHALKVLNIMENPVYVDEIQYIRKKSQKLRELYNLKSYFQSNLQQKFLTYQLGKVFIVAKAHKDPLTLGNSINYANNITELKSYAYAQKAIVSMQKHNIKKQFNNMISEMTPKLAQHLFKSLRKLYLNYNSLQTLQGLKNFVNLQVLYLRHNELKTLKGVEGMKDLLLLRCDDNKVEDLEPLSGLIGLKRLMGSDNRIKSLEPLRNLTLLKTIEFEKNQIESLEPIKDLHDIQDLNFKNNPLITTLPQFVSKSIKYIALSGTSINQQQLYSLSNYTSVSRLILENLKLKEIPSFISSLKLSELWLGNNDITQITNLQDQSQLQILSLKNNKVTSLKGIESLQKIRSIYMENNQLQSLEGLKPCFQTLKHINLKQNPLDDIKHIMYAEDTLKFDYTRQMLSQKALAFLDQLYFSKVNSSGSED